jgi:hypothetical protein
LECGTAVRTVRINNPDISEMAERNFQTHHHK